VTDGEGVQGIVSQAQIDKAVANSEGNKTLEDLIDSLGFPHVHADHPLYVALERMGTAKLDVLPVVSRADIHELLGLVALPDVLNAFGVEGRDSVDPGS
jgi:predicted transcriptional regulator